MKHKKAFTLIELLIASSILMMVISMSLRIFFNITRLNTYIELTNVLQFESKSTLERIAREIQNSTIDYPEYYNYYVLNGAGQNFVRGNLGSNYSTYAMRFYNPGMVASSLSTQGSNVSGIDTDDLGSWCQWGSSALNVAPMTVSLCDGIPSLEDTEDYATGTNPYTSSVFTAPTQASAVCDSTSEMFVYSQSQCPTSATEAHEVDMLFLMSGDGLTKTMITREPFDVSSYVVSMLRMTGSDTDNDGVRETWVCADGFVCQDSTGTLPELSSAKLEDLNDINDYDNLYKDFAPISPYNLDITDLRFYIAPIEDPHKAYDEFPQIIQPYVTIVMTATVNDPRIDQLPVLQRSITLQTTVSSGVYDEITSYSGE